jgi:hypothetical protein
LHRTRATFYARELWRSEGLFAVALLVGLATTLLWAVRKRARADLLVASWALALYALFSLAASRYDYYALLAYPALALGLAALLVNRLPLPAWSRAALVVLYLALAGSAHLPRNLGAFEGEDEVRSLMRLAEDRLPAHARIYTYNTHPYAARYYSSHDIITLLESAEDVQQASAMAATGLPTEVRYAPHLDRTLDELPRPFVLLLPRARAALLPAGRLTAVGDTRHYLLLLRE